jgi:prepilin-type N-terminal cleavage/methylation domain-containing protein
MLARLRTRLAQEDGMTLIELLTTMAILGLVMTAVVGVFVTGLRAESDMNKRFLAQQNARLALSALRNEIGSACSVTVGAVSSPAETFGSQLTLVLPNRTPASGTSACSSGTTSVIWCAASTTAVAPYGLYRSTTGTCSATSGQKKAGALKCAGTPTPPSTCSAVFIKTSNASQYPTVTVTFPVQANLRNTHGLYTLQDTIMARNAGIGS